MVAVQAGEDEVLPELERFGGSVCLAAVNTPGSLVLSGDEDAVLELAGVWEERGRKTKRLGVSHAFHSARMDGMLAEFKSVLEGVSFSEPQLPIISNLTGQPATSEICTPEYWVSHARSTVRFAEGVRWLEGQGVNKYLELGPDGTLSAITQENHDATPPVVVTPVLREDHPENETLLEALAHAWVSGVNIDWNTIFHGTGAKRVGLPAYAFQRERYWLESARGVNDLASVGQGAAEHPLLGAVVGSAGDGWLFTGRLSLQNDPWLADHVVFGHVVLAGTVFLELVLCAGREIGCEGIGELTLHAPLVLPEHGGVQIQVRVGEPEQTGDRQVTVSSRPDDNTEKPDESWTTHAQGTLTTNTNQTHNHDDHTTINTQEWPPTGSETVEVQEIYDALAGKGLEYGPVFQGLRNVWRDGSDIYAEVALPDELRSHAEPFAIHPALLDATLHALALGVNGAGVQSAAMLPFSWSDVVVVSRGACSVRVHLTLDSGERASLTVVDEDGGLVASIGSLALRELSQKQLRDSLGTGEDSLFGVNWTPISTSSVVEGDVSRLVVVGGDSLGLADDMGVDGVSVRSYPDMSCFRDAMKEGEVPDCVLMCCSPAEQLAMGPQGVWDIGVPEAVHDGTNRVLEAMQEWLADERLDVVRLVVLTRGAVSVGVGDGIFDLGGCAIWGLVRSAQTESPARFTLLDVDSEEFSGDALIEAINASVSLEEPQLAIRAGKTLVPRLGTLETNSTLRLPSEASEWCLDVGDAGTLDDFELVRSPAANEPLQAGQIRVEMRAAGLNFRDVLIALGAYPDKASVGGEGAGIVVEVGEEVQDLSPGDRVMGFFEGAFSTVVATDRRVVVRIPEDWSFAQAASVPIAFCTAYYGLVDLARLRADERLLVHAA